MSERISVAALQSVVDKALVNAKLRPGPLIFGFVAPDGIEMAEAHKIATVVARESGIAGTPTVANLATAATAGVGERALKLPHRIIIGLIQDDR